MFFRPNKAFTRRYKTLMQLQKSLEPYQKIPKSVVVQHIGVGAGKFLGCEGFLPEFSQTCLKKAP